MARKKNPVDIINTSEIPVTEREDTDAVQHAAVERMALVLRQFSDGVPFDPAHYEYIIRDHLKRSAESMLAAGRALIVSRESLGHGDWMSFVERVGIEQRLANRMMQAALKFSDPKTMKLIEAAGNKTKVFELLVLDDEQIQELADGGTVAGLELDDIAEMSTSELRRNLRDAREERKASEKLLADKNEKLDTLAANLTKAESRRAQATIDEQVVDATHDVAGICIGVTAEIMTPLREAIGRLLTLQPDAGASITGHVTQVRHALDEISVEYALGTVAPVVPDWADAD